MPSNRKRREKRIMRKVLARSAVSANGFNLESLYNRGGAHHTTQIINATKSSVLRSQYVAKVLKRNDPTILPFQQGGGMASTQDTDGAGIMSTIDQGSEAAWTGVDIGSLPHFVTEISFPFNGEAAPIQKTTPLTWPAGVGPQAAGSGITLTDAPETLGIGGSQVMIYSSNGPKIPYVPAYSVGGGWYANQLSENGSTEKRIARIYFHGSMYDQGAVGTTPDAQGTLGNYIHVSGAGSVNGNFGDPLQVYNLQYWPTQSVAQAAIAFNCEDQPGYAHLITSGCVLTITGADLTTTYVLSSSIAHPGVNITSTAGTFADPFVFSTGSDSGSCMLNLKDVLGSVASKDFVARTLEPGWAEYAVAADPDRAALILYSKELGTNNAAQISSSNTASLDVWVPNFSSDEPASAGTHTALTLPAAGCFFSSSGGNTASNLGSIMSSEMDDAGRVPAWMTCSLPYSSSIAADLTWDYNPLGITATTLTTPFPGMAFYFKGSDTTGSVINESRGI